MTNELLKIGHTHYSLSYVPLLIIIQQIAKQVNSKWYMMSPKCICNKLLLLFSMQNIHEWVGEKYNNDFSLVACAITGYGGKHVIWMAFNKKISFAFYVPAPVHVFYSCHLLPFVSIAICVVWIAYRFAISCESTQPYYIDNDKRLQESVYGCLCVSVCVCYKAHQAYICYTSVRLCIVHCQHGAYCTLAFKDWLTAWAWGIYTFLSLESLTLHKIHTCLMLCTHTHYTRS